MNILLDFIPFQQNGVGGGASFCKAVSDAVCQRKGIHDSIYAIFNSSLHPGKQYNCIDYASTNGIHLLDIATNSISEYVVKHDIDTFFIAIAQFYAKYSLEGINCKVVMGIHDIWDVEREDNGIDYISHDGVAESKWQWGKRIFGALSGHYRKRQRAIYKHVIPLFASSNTVAFTVSNYTRNALKYYFPELSGKAIHVFYSPAREVQMENDIQDERLCQLVAKKQAYLFMVAANRRLKNPKTLMKVYRRLLVDFPQLHLLTLKYGHTVHPNHVDINFLSDSDLEHAYKNAHALIFGSYFEGFGYPPVEAMKHGTPTVASNVTSIPEILGGAGVFFSPFYPADMYRAIRQVLDNRQCRQEQICNRYAEVSKRQKEDLGKLVAELFTC